uniref:Uncharacterized protein n=1 Tax=Anguilla anguilla TaxID=7936 RepID=A0A0E9Q4V5_ANGAN
MMMVSNLVCFSLGRACVSRALGCARRFFQ